MSEMGEPNPLITAILRFEIPSEVSIEDPESEIGSLFHSVLTDAVKGSGHPLYWGRTYETPGIVIIVAGECSLSLVRPPHLQIVIHRGPRCPVQ